MQYNKEERLKGLSGIGSKNNKDKLKGVKFSIKALNKDRKVKSSSTLNAMRPLYKKSFRHEDERKVYHNQSDLFTDVSKKRTSICTVCSRRVVMFESYCFAHICNKKTYPELKFHENNIALVCGMQCHNKMDEMCNRNKPWLARAIKAGYYPDPTDLDNEYENCKGLGIL